MYIFVVVLYRLNVFFKNKKYLFLDNISNMFDLAYYFFSFYFIQLVSRVWLFILLFDSIKN